MLRSYFLAGWEFAGKAVPVARGVFYRCVLGLPFQRVGRNLKIRGGRKMSLGPSVAIGNYCWIEAISSYNGHHYEPCLRIGSQVAISDWSHISAVCSIEIGDGCLIGSKVYIGDHSHGSLRPENLDLRVFPAKRPLGDIAPVSIGAASWIGDGVVILAGTHIAPGSVVGANSVVRLKEGRPALIAGVPARVVRYLD
jgi:acetyltransferase-like isoleucine patch superfamily enzyme